MGEEVEGEVGVEVVRIVDEGMTGFLAIALREEAMVLIGLVVEESPVGGVETVEGLAGRESGGRGGAVGLVVVVTGLVVGWLSL